jgi:glycosyltransferase involved in cell wall biosynthesis
VLPQQRRLDAFVEQTRRHGRSICVWNCPRLAEVAPARAPHDPGAGLAFYYHGSLNAERLPFSVVDALAHAGDKARLIVVGYETVGSRGYVRDLMRRASEAGVEGRIEYLGPVARRASMLRAAAEADVGLAFMPASTNDLNMTFMTGASNKPFDYLAVGQMLLVSDLPDWREMYVAPGYGRACDPYDAARLGQAMRWCVEHPEEVRAAGEAGRLRILSEWTYERCFAPVREMLEARSARASQGARNAA